MHAADPPGEEHWHGATEGTMMCHYALVEEPEDDTPATTWLDPVTDEQYRAAHQGGDRGRRPPRHHARQVRGRPPL